MITISPADGSRVEQNTAVDLAYAWGAVPGATWYQLYIQDSAGNLNTQWHRAADVCSAICGLQPSFLPTNGETTWWIQPYGDLDDNGTETDFGVWSIPSWFRFQQAGQFQLVVPEVSDPVSWLKGSFGIEDTISWGYLYPGFIPCPVEYWLQLDTSRGGTDLFDESTGTNTSQFIRLGDSGYNLYARLWYRFGSSWRFHELRWFVRKAS